LVSQIVLVKLLAAEASAGVQDATMVGPVVTGGGQVTVAPAVGPDGVQTPPVAMTEPVSVVWQSVAVPTV
jgi:hypothetical protein